MKFHRFFSSLLVNLSAHCTHFFSPRHYAYLILGHELVLQNEFENAVQCFRNALRVRPRLINALLGIGEVYMKEEYFDRAAQVYQIALKYVPKSPTVWSNVGRAHYEQGNHPMALKCFEKVG